MKKLFILGLLLTASIASEKIYGMFDVKASQEAILSLEISGIVKDIRVDVGDRVKKGDVLLVLDNSAQKHSLDRVKYNYEHAKSSYGRYKKLKGVIDKEKYESVEFNKNIAKTDFESAKIAYEKTFLKAPFDGVISEKKIELGTGISGMQNTPLFKLTNSDEVKLVVTFDEKYWKSVKAGDKFVYKVDGENNIREGLISKVYPTVNPKNRKLTAEVVTKELLPGLFGDGFIIPSQEEQSRPSVEALYQ